MFVLSEIIQIGWYSKLGGGISNIIPKGKICPITCHCTIELELTKAANFDPEHFLEGQIDD